MCLSRRGGGAYGPDRWSGAGRIPHTVASIGHIRSGRLRALAVTAATRSELLPDIPTVVICSWATKRAPGTWHLRTKGHVRRIVDKLNKEIKAGLADPKSTQGLPTWAGRASPRPPLRELIAEETEKWAKVVKFAGIKAD